MLSNCSTTIFLQVGELRSGIFGATWSETSPLPLGLVNPQCLEFVCPLLLWLSGVSPPVAPRNGPKLPARPMKASLLASK